MHISFQVEHCFFRAFLMPNNPSDKPAKVKPNKKDSQLLIRISSTEREQFLRLCEKLDTSAAREIRSFIRGFIQKHEPAE